MQDAAQNPLTDSEMDLIEELISEITELARKAGLTFVGCFAHPDEHDVIHIRHRAATPDLTWRGVAMLEACLNNLDVLREELARSKCQTFTD